MNEVDWLKNKLSESGVTSKIIKTYAMMKLNHPKSQKLRSFVGSINHLSKFFQISATLTKNFAHGSGKTREKLRKTKVPLKKFEHGKEHSASLEVIKNAVMNLK